MQVKEAVSYAEGMLNSLVRNRGHIEDVARWLIYSARALGQRVTREYEGTIISALPTSTVPEIVRAFERVAYNRNSDLSGLDIPIFQ